MLRRASLCLAATLSLLLAPACKKDAEEGDDKAEKAEDDDGDKAEAEGDKAEAEKDEPEVPAEVEVPAGDDGDKAGGGGAGAGGAGGGGAGGAGAPIGDGEDRSCEPLEKGSCLEGEQCIGGQGCDAVWQCDATIVCKKGVREYCGCDGRTFEAVYGNCPWKKYEHPGPCK